MGAARVRAAVALFGEVCDDARRRHGSEERWWTQPIEVQVGSWAAGAALSLVEAETASEDLQAAQLVRVTERGVAVDVDALCECPALEIFDWERARGRLEDGGQLVGPTTALLREIVRLADARGVLNTTFARLLEATLYGRTRVTQSLSVLQEAGLVERSDLANRMLRLELLANHAPAPRRAAAPAGHPAPHTGDSGRIRLPTNAPLQIGGQPLELAPGMVPELELAADGQYYLWIGPVRIGPYTP